MRISIKFFYLLAVIGVAVAVQSCNEEKIEYGEPAIYMPQATVSGGVTNIYYAPAGGGALTYNFKVHDGKIDIILGVTRSGTEVGKDFSVDVVEMTSETQKFVASEGVDNAMVLPAGSYSLPSKVEVKNSTGATFYLTLDSAKLMSDFSLTGKNLVLAVGIANPTQYKLSDKNTVTMVVIDVEALRDLFFKYKENVVYRKGTKLYLNGKEYTCVSFNAFSLSGCGSVDETFTDSEIEALFASLPKNIMIRTWAFAGNKAHTDKLIKKAEQYNIKLILTLGNGRNYCGDVDGAVDGEWSPKSEAWYAGGFRGVYLAHVKDMASTYKDSPAIGMWEILNEPVDADWQLIKSFMHEVAQAIKTADPNHLVATGTWAQWAYGGEDNLREIHNSNYIDVGTLHEGDDDVAKSWHYDALKNSMSALKKVTMVGDISIEGGTGCKYGIKERADRVKEKFDTYLGEGASVVLVSSLAKTATGCNNFAPDDPLMETIKNYTANKGNE